jgi:hypothetical protein
MVLAVFDYCDVIWDTLKSQRHSRLTQTQEKNYKQEQKKS